VPMLQTVYFRVPLCRCIMAERNRFNIQLDDEHATKLRTLAARTHVNPGTLARSLLATALENADPDPESIVSLLDAIPGAFERAQEGLRQVRGGKGMPLSEF
jgi:inactivated superfamily I helicase